MNSIKGMTALRSYPRDTTIGVIPQRDDVEIDLGQKYGKIIAPFFYVVHDDEIPHLVEWMQRNKRLAFDTETGGAGPMDGLDPLVGKVATLQIGNPTCADPRVYVIDARCVSAASLAPVMAILADTKTKKLGQNVRFEYKFLRTNFGVMCRALEDTQLNEQVIRMGLFRGASSGDDGEGRSRAAYKHTSMDALCSFYLGIKIDKDKYLRTSFYNTPPGQHEVRQRLYAGGDVVYPFYVAREQYAELEARQLLSIAKLEHSIVPSLGEAELRGMYLDQDAWRALWQEALASLLDARRRLDALFLSVQGDLFNGSDANVRPIYIKSRKSPPLNWGSSDQVKWAIAQYCKAIGWKHEIITDYEHLLKVKELCGAAWRARKAEKGQEVKVEDTPDWVIPESEYCILLKAEKDTLVIRACRGQLPWELVDPLTDYSKFAKRVGTYGLKFLAKNIRKDTGRFHFEIHQLITTTGRISTQPNCYDGATEILTQHGWVAFSDLQDGVEVAQVDPTTDEVTFAVPSRVVRQAYAGNMLHFTTDQGQIDLMVTPNHRMLIGTRCGKKQFVSAQELASSSFDHVKQFHGGTFGGGNAMLTPDEVRLAVAIQADGSITKHGQIDFTFKKARKILRLRELLQATGTPYRETTKGDRTRFIVLPKDSTRFTELLTAEKVFGPWVLTLSRDALDAFIAEVWLWDGCSTTLSQYCSKDRRNADYVQAAHALSGQRIRLRPYVNNGGGEYWLADVTRRNHSMLDNASVRAEPAPDGKVYCVTVPTGAVIVRRQTAAGAWVTAVSSNSQNIPNDKRYRACFKASPGKKLVLADYSSVEPRITAFVSRDPVYCSTFLAGDDLYIASAEHSLGYRPNKHEPEGAFQRQLSKVRVLSLAYNMGLMKYRDRLTLALMKDIRAGKVEAPTVDFAREQYDGFFEVHPGVEKWQAEMADIADPKKSKRKIWDSFINAEVTWVEAPCGRKRFFPPDANPYSEAPNVPPQAGSASMIKAAVALMERRLDEQGWSERAYLVNTVHDEPIYEADEDVASEVAVMLRECMEQAGNFYNGDIPIVAEFPENSDGTVPYWTKALPEHVAIEEQELYDEAAIEEANAILDAQFAKAA